MSGNSHRDTVLLNPVDKARPIDKMRPMPAAWLEACLKLEPVDPLLDGVPSSALLLDRLERAGRIEAALRLAAHALPPREAIWWACMCARHTAQADPVQADAAAGVAAEDWVRRPDDAARLRAYRAARQARYGSPEALAAMGVYWSDATRALSMSSEAAAGQLGNSIENAVRLASVRGPLSEHSARGFAFLGSARDIARGGAGHLGANHLGNEAGTTSDGSTSGIPAGAPR